VLSQQDVAGEVNETSSSQAVAPEWLRPLDSYGWSAVARNVLPLLALLGIAPVLASWKAWAPWLLVPVVGLFLYRVTVVMHDCTHHTLFRQRRLNATVGLVLGAFSGVDFDSFCRQHWQHHRSYGRTDDPQGFQYLALRHMTPRRLRWHLVKPLFGLSLPRVFVESILSPRNVLRLLRSGEFVIVAVVQLGLLALVTGAGRYPLLAALPFVSGATFGLFFSQVRGIAEHGVMGVGDSYLVRSHESRWFERIFLYDVHFNYHAEHHAWPRIPSCHLPAFQRTTSTTVMSVSMFRTLRTFYDGSKSPHG
jgi:fatty acid desaturase